MIARNYKTSIFAFILFAAFNLHGQSAISVLEMQKIEAATRTENKELAVTVYYLERNPFAFQTETGEMPTGIEPDILQAFVFWLKTQNIGISMEFIRFTEVDEFLNRIENGGRLAIGIGNITITEERKKNVDFTAPFLRNISVLISGSGIETAYNWEEFKKYFAGKTAIASKGSVHVKHLLQLKEKYLPNLKIEYVDNQAMVPKRILENPEHYFGYVDIVTFWQFIKNNNAFIKMHKVANIHDEYLAMVLPKKSLLAAYLSEFYEKGFGFTATKQYHEILRRYLGREIIPTVEINPIYSSFLNK